MKNKTIDYVTTGIAARELGLSTSTVFRLAYSGKARCYQTPGGHYRVHLGDLRASMGLGKGERPEPVKRGRM